MYPAKYKQQLLMKYLEPLTFAYEVWDNCCAAATCTLVHHASLLSAWLYAAAWELLPLRAQWFVCLLTALTTC
jgi:hypothetical protein